MLLLLLLCLPACDAALINSKPAKITEVRPAPMGLTTIDFTIPKQKLSIAIEASRGSSNVRIIPLVTSATQAPSTPEYRLFNVRKGSVAALLNLKNADILVAVSEYVVRDPRQFYAYLEALRSEKVAQIEVRREGKPILFKYNFVE